MLDICKCKVSTAEIISGHGKVLCKRTHYAQVIRPRNGMRDAGAHAMTAMRAWVAIEVRKKMLQHSHFILVVTLTLIPGTLSVCLLVCLILPSAAPVAENDTYWPGLPHQRSSTYTRSATTLVGNAEHRIT